MNRDQEALRNHDIHAFQLEATGSDATAHDDHVKEFVVARVTRRRLGEQSVLNHFVIEHVERGEHLLGGCRMDDFDVDPNEASCLQRGDQLARS